MADTAAAIVLGVAVLTALGVAVRRLRLAFRALENLAALLEMTGQVRDLVQRELNHNHGGSIKDDVVGTALGLQRAHNRVDQLEDRQDQVLDRLDQLENQTAEIRNLLTQHLETT